MTCARRPANKASRHRGDDGAADGADAPWHHDDDAPHGARRARLHGRGVAGGATALHHCAIQTRSATLPARHRTTRFQLGPHMGQARCVGPCTTCACIAQAPHIGTTPICAYAQTAMCPWECASSLASAFRNAPGRSTPSPPRPQHSRVLVHARLWVPSCMCACFLALHTTTTPTVHACRRVQSHAMSMSPPAKRTGCSAG